MRLVLLLPQLLAARRTTTALRVHFQCKSVLLARSLLVVVLHFALLAMPVVTVQVLAPKPLVQMATTAMVMFKHLVLLAHGWPQQSRNQLMHNV